MNYSNSQRAGVILYLTALLFGGYDKAYTQVSKEMVREAVQVMCEGNVYYSESGTRVTITPHVVGTTFPTGKNESYVFCEGTDHNRLTITDPEEIVLFRAFVDTHDQFREISFEN